MHHGDTRLTTMQHHNPMKNTEKSFADRLQRGREMNAATVGFTPAFTPGQDDVTPGKFADFLANLDRLNLTVAEHEANWRTSIPDRNALVKDIKTRAMRAMARVKSDAKWAAKMPAVKLVYDNLRGYRAPAPKSPPADGEKIAPRRPSTTSQSFADIKNLADRFVTSLKKLSGYDTGAPADLTTAEIASLCVDLADLNRSIADVEVELSNARSERSLGYDGPAGLSEKMKSIKQATLAQYGRDSAAYAAVKGIKL